MKNYGSEELIPATAICVLNANYPDEHFQDLRTAVDLAIDALEKQIPKKIVCNHCPTCEVNVIGSGYYCWNCGQKLDWEVNKPWIAHEKDYE